MQNTTVQPASCSKLRCTEVEVVDYPYTQGNCETMSKTLRDEKSATHAATRDVK